MKGSFWTSYISDHTIHAICWTLIHSLWIGLAIALLAGLTISVTRKSSAALRYNLLCGILVLFTASVWVAFFIEMQAPAMEQEPFRVGQIINTPGNHLMIIPAATAPHLSLFTRLVWLLNQYANVIFLAWLLLFVLKSLKMAGGLLYIQRIRNYKVHEVSEEFKHKIEVFAGQIGIRQAVRLAQSELVKVPVAVGWLKPVILLPMGILLQLSPEQLESILWHELAHIRRRDYLVNILQGLVETVFFFNPGLLWLSSLIRAEREACCDDIVLSRMNRKANYLEALLAFGNEDNNRMPLAMSIGSGSQLRDRLKRMINKENKRLNMAEKVVLVAGLIVLSAFTSLPKTTQNAVKHLVDVVIKKPGHADTVRSKAIGTDSATKQISVFRQTEVISSDTVHGKTNILAPFRSVLFKNSDADLANNDISAEDTTGKKYHFIVADNKLVAMEINGEKVKESDLPNYQYMITQIDIAVLEKRHIRETDMARFKANSPDAKFKADQYKMRYADSLRFKPGVKFKSDQFKMRYADSLRLKSFNNKDGINLKLEAMRQRFRDDSVSYDAQHDRAYNVIGDLVHDKAVADPASVKWFGLSNTEFIVNGQKESAEMQQRYKAKYGISEGNGLYYGPVQMHGVGVFIDADPTQPPLPPGSPRKSKAPKGSGNVRPKYADTSLYFTSIMLKDGSANWDNNDISAVDNKDNKYHFIVVDGKIASMELNGAKIAESKLPGYEYTFQLMISEMIEERRGLEMQRRNLGVQRLQLADAQKAELERNIKQQQLIQAMRADQRLKFQPLKFNKQEFKELYVGPSISLNDVMASITNDLVDAHVLGDKSDLVKFNLTNSALMVNGIKQPEELHERLKAKYLKQPDYKIDPEFAARPYFGLHFNAQSGNMGLGTTDGPDSP